MAIIKRKLSSVFMVFALTVVMSLGALVVAPMPVYADTVEWNGEATTIGVINSGATIEVSSSAFGTLTIPDGVTMLTIQGVVANTAISNAQIKFNGNSDIYLSLIDISITAPSGESALLSAGTGMLTLDCTNVTLTGGGDPGDGYGSNGIYTTYLTISGTGSLTASGGDCTGSGGSGIVATSRLNISGGVVTANGGDGDSRGGNGIVATGSLNITGGTVTAKGGGDGGDDDSSNNGGDGIVAKDSFTITGGTITANGGDGDDGNGGNGISVADLTISGTDSLTANGGRGGDIVGNGGSGIAATGNFDITGGTVTATGGYGGEGGDSGDGVYATNLSISDTGSLTANGGYGLDGGRGIYTTNLEISDTGSLTATGGNGGSGSSGSSGIGIMTTGNFKITGGTVTASGGYSGDGIYAANLAISGSSSLIATGGDSGSYVNKDGGNGIVTTGSLTIAGGTVTASGNNGRHGGSGIVANNSFNIEGGTVTAKGDFGLFNNGDGIYADQITLSGTVDAIGGMGGDGASGKSIKSNNPVIFADPLANMTVKEAEDTNDIKIVIDSTYAPTYRFVATGGVTLNDPIATTTATSSTTAGTVSLQAKESPTFTSKDNASFASGIGGTFQVRASGDDPITYSQIGAPAGVSLDTATGSMTIDPSVEVGTYQFTITASSGGNLNTNQNFTLTITATPAPPVNHDPTDAPDRNKPIDTSKDFSITFNGDFVKLIDIKINGHSITRTLTDPMGATLTGYPGYSGVLGKAESGSVIITLYKEFLQWLPSNSYDIEVVFNDGGVISSGSAVFLISKTPAPTPPPAPDTVGGGTTTIGPRTGDGTPIGLLIVLMVMAGTGLTRLVIKRRLAKN